MNDEIRHRGPDDEGVWADASSGLVLGSRRLAVIDLSQAGHQPMVSPCGRFVIVYNGEVYNFACLRKRLQEAGCRFKSRTDTEVILQGCAQWGIRKTLQRLNGMFAFALWDNRSKRLTLARDRLGIKPLYYGWSGSSFFFASELKALRVHPDFQAQLDLDSLILFFRHSYIPSPYSIYHNVLKLRPGSFLTIDAPAGGRPTPEEYWSPKMMAEDGQLKRFQGGSDQAVDRLEKSLSEAVRLRLVADVPIGAFLSGGIDSSTVVALMQAHAPSPVKTFSIGFDESGYDEAQEAAKVARHLGTDHTELYVSPRQACEVIASLPRMYDEPFADSSQIPTFLVSRLTRRSVTVSLSGDGGDELFGGYDDYFRGRRRWDLVRRLPRPVRGLGGTGLHLWAALAPMLKPVLPPGLAVRASADRTRKARLVLQARSPEALHRCSVSHWPQPANLVRGASEPPTPFTDSQRWARLRHCEERMMFMDLTTYLPEDLLAKVDRASMAVSLEARVPLLDHRVVEFAWRLPLNLKIRQGEGKWILRQVLCRYVPRSLVDRPKMGFRIPVGEWLRGPLRSWSEELLSEPRLKREGILCSSLVRRIWQEHLHGHQSWDSMLWTVLMFQAWKQEWM